MIGVNLVVVGNMGVRGGGHEDDDRTVGYGII